MAKVQNGVETSPKSAIALVGCTNVTDRRQYRQTTDGRTMTYSEHELEFTFAKKWWPFLAVVSSQLPPFDVLCPVFFLNSVHNFFDSGVTPWIIMSPGWVQPPDPSSDATGCRKETVRLLRESVLANVTCDDILRTLLSYLQPLWLIRLAKLSNSSAWRK